MADDSTAENEIQGHCADRQKGTEMSINPHPMDQTELPEIITRYLRAHQARDLDAAIECYTIDASVTDEGRTYNGPQEIRAWLARSASEFTYTIEVIGATKSDDDH